MVLLTDFLDSHPYITQVRSLTNFQYIHADGDNLSTDYLIDDPDTLAQDPTAIASAKAILQGEPLAMGTLITADFRHARIAARVEYHPGTSSHKTELVQDLYRYIDAEIPDSDQYTLHVSGYPVAYERFETLADEDLDLLIPFMILLMVIMLYLNFRSLVGTVFPWVVIAGGVLLVGEIQSYLQLPHSTVDSALLPTLIIIGIGITVHVLVEYFHQRRLGLDSKAASHTAILHIWRPALFASITTSAGFYALSITKILPVRDFALLGAIGPLALFLFAVTVLPAMLSYVKVLPPGTVAMLDTGVIARLIASVPEFTRRHRNSILVCGALALVFSLVYIPTIKVDTNYVAIFKANNPAREDIDYFDRVFKGTMTLDVVLDSGAVDGIKDPAFLAQLQTIELWLEARPPLGQINSLVDYLKEINQALHNDNPEYYRLPDSQAMTAQYLFLYESAGPDEDLSDIRDFDDRYVRFTIPIVNMATSDMQAELDAITRYMQGEFGHLKPLLTGTMVLFTVQDIYTSQGMFQSFTLALLVITGFFIALLKSFKYGFLAMVPSVLPIVLTASVAAMLGVYMDLSTMIVGAMTMGIAVDDSIHVMSRYLMAGDNGASAPAAIERAMGESGRAVVFSSLVLVLGFSILCFASITTVIYVGLFGSIIMSLALLGDLLLLPALLYLVDDSEQLPTGADANDTSDKSPIG